MIKVYCEDCWERLKKELKELKERKVSAVCDGCEEELKEGDHVFCRGCYEKKTGYFIR